MNSLLRRSLGISLLTLSLSACGLLGSGSGSQTPSRQPLTATRQPLTATPKPLSAWLWAAAHPKASPISA